MVVTPLSTTSPSGQNNLLLLPFTAQLVPDGSGAAVGVGTFFQVIATFSFTYE